MNPEQYWIDRHSDVIGTDVLRLGANARQATTYRVIADWLIRRGATDVLDVGCNVAALAMFLRAMGYGGRYKGVDSNPHALRIAQHGERAELGNLRCLECGDQDHEVVVVKDVIEHLESYEPLAEAFRVARAYVVVATYLPWTDAPADIVRHADGYYTNRYRNADVLALATRCDFSLIEQSAVSEVTGWANQVTFWARNR